MKHARVWPQHVHTFGDQIVVTSTSGTCVRRVVGPPDGVPLSYSPPDRELEFWNRQLPMEVRNGAHS